MKEDSLRDILIQYSKFFNRQWLKYGNETSYPEIADKFINKLNNYENRH